MKQGRYVLGFKAISFVLAAALKHENSQGKSSFDRRGYEHPS